MRNIMKQGAAAVLAGLVFLFILFPGHLIGLDWGLKAGGTLAFAFEQEKSIIYYPSSLLAAKAGVFVTFPLAGSLSLQPELSFSMKGFHYYNVSRRQTMTVTLNYLEIPVFMRMAVLDKVALSFGPYVGFLIKRPALDHHPNKWMWPEYLINDIDTGLALATSYRWLKLFFVEINVFKGLSRVAYDPEAGPADFRKPFRNTTVSLLLGAMF